MCGRRGLERYVKGYRKIRDALEKKREELANNQSPVQYHLRENMIKVEFYKPVVATRYKTISSVKENLLHNFFLCKNEKTWRTLPHRHCGKNGIFSASLSVIDVNRNILNYLSYYNIIEKLISRIINMMKILIIVVE